MYEHIKDLKGPDSQLQEHKVQASPCGGHEGKKCIYIQEIIHTDKIFKQQNTYNS